MSLVGSETTKTVTARGEALQALGRGAVLARTGVVWSRSDAGALCRALRAKCIEDVMYSRLLGEAIHMNFDVCRGLTLKLVQLQYNPGSRVCLDAL